jgi:predicted HTH transcriptional regulator
LLASESVTFESVYDDIRILREKEQTYEVEQEILSNLRRKKAEENYELEVKEMLFQKDSRKVTQSFLETIIAFLNSPNGGDLLAGIEDDTYNIRGIEVDLAKYDGSVDKLKQALQNAFDDFIHPDLQKWLPKIEYTFHQVQGKRILHVKIPPGQYTDGLYIDRQGKAYLRKDGRLSREESPIAQDAYSRQRRNNEGLWSQK